ncbi:transporter [Solilutibacter silvestris]|uniref:MetA-pathway of phenol degradation n=1 Tax=Solilutibacter silvestris TaxID=1645665 RepID=A0A2K1PYN2_9GAMM|nr:transporter [Lysobacter silvestris]PNS07904.1 hypothetical protein Lysil_2080 [Lysobacter silvestris]
MAIALRWMMCLLVLATPIRIVHAQSQDAQDVDPQFDRPGISFASWSLPAGSVAWEQGLPDATWQHDGEAHVFQAVADSHLRIGMGHGLELQLIGSPYAFQRLSGGGSRQNAHGQGDGALALKWTPTAPSAAWSWAVLGTHKLASGDATFGTQGRAEQLAVTVTRSLDGNQSLTGSVARDLQASGNGWLTSLSYGFPIGSRVAGYLQAGSGSGVDRTRVAGGGVTMLLRHRVQLDGWLLRGLDRNSPDWQAGFGVSMALTRGR